MDTKTVLASLGTEQVNSASVRLDEMSSLEIASLMNDVTADVTRGVQKALPQIAQAIDGIVDRFRTGGRLIYMGAGTSGRLGVLDASECPPTFGVSPDMVVGVIAGGDSALRSASEGAEDSETLPVQDLKALKLTDKDAVVAISASGYAPYCRAALRYARETGALAIALSCNENALTSREADIAIEAPTGGEVLSGSTRLKAGTATKIILNMLTTGSMVRLGKCYRNLMVDVRPTNVKLKDRAVRITMNATGLDREAAAALLDQAGSIKCAIVMHEAGVPRPEAERALTAAGGVVKKALREIGV